MIRILKIIPFLAVFFVINFLGCQLINKVGVKNVEEGKNYELQFQLTDLIVKVGLLNITLTDEKSNPENIVYDFFIINKSSLTLDIYNIVINYSHPIRAASKSLNTFKFAVEEHIMPNSQSSLSYSHENLFKEYTDLSNQRKMFVDSIGIVGFNKEIYKNTKESLKKIIKNDLKNQKEIDKEYLYDLEESLGWLPRWKETETTALGIIISLGLLVIDFVYPFLSIILYDIVYPPKIENYPNLFQEAVTKLEKQSEVYGRLPSSLREKFEKRELPWKDLDDAIESTGFTIEEAATLSPEELEPIIQFLEKRLKERG